MNLILQCVSIRFVLFVSYGVIWGYFDLIKVTLKVMPCLWASGSKQILIGLSNENLKFKLLAQLVAKLWAIKVGGPNKLLVLLGSRLRFSRFHYCKLGLRAIRVRFPVAAQFEGLQFWSPWAYKHKIYLFWNIWSIFITII